MNLSQTNKRLIFFGLFFILLIVRIPFYYTHHIQEDAYITLRCADNLAQTGVYGYNAGEKVSASTSHLYVLIAALVRVISGQEAFIPAIQVVNSLLFIAGAFFFASVLGRSEKIKLVLWILVSLLPISLQISYSGMETSLLIFMTGLILFLLDTNQHHWMAMGGIALLPWIRPDAIAYGLIILFWECVKRKKIDLPLLGGFFTGLLSLLLFNQLYFGSILNQSIIAKAQTRHAFSIGEFLTTLKLIFVVKNGGIFTPVLTKYFEPLGLLFLMVILAATAYYLIRLHKRGMNVSIGIGLACLVFLIPIAYVAGGVIYQWYFWPATFLGYAFLCTILAEWISAGDRTAKIFSVALALLVVAGMLLQWVYSYSWGMKEFSYRGGIGRQLREIARKDDTLFLEPAGYIPYYSGLYTYDEAGLGSPLVLHFRELYQTPWWIRFVEQAKPDWIVQRSHFSTFATYQGYTLNQEEQRWFIKNYHLVELKTYQPRDYTTNPLLLRLLSLGTADDYYIYEINR